MTTHANGGAPLVGIDRLAVTFYTPRGTIRAVREASLEVKRGEVVGLVGESGCGKSTLAFALMGYLPGIAQVDGSILFEGRDVAQLRGAELRSLRGNRMAMVYQDPATSLNPTMRIGAQMEEVLREHLHMDGQQARQRTAELFESVGLPNPHTIRERFPHQLSGGMQQRVVIAMALACDPDLLIMDEPTTGLDVTTEATILDLVADLKHRVGAGILFVSHNLGVIARVADRVVVMYAGQTVEEAPVRELYRSPRHPYTAGLLSCVPKPPGDGEALAKLTSLPGTVFPARQPTESACLFAARCPIARDVCRSEAPGMLGSGGGRRSRCFFGAEVRPDMWGEEEQREPATKREAVPVLEARDLRRSYGQWRRKFLFFGPRVQPPVRALTDVDFSVGRARTLGIVGESGSGKTTAARVVSGLAARDRGDLSLHEETLAPDVADRKLEHLAQIRMVFQNPAASLNPKLPIRSAIVRAIQRFGGPGKREARTRAADLMVAVGLDPSYLDRRPKELSGGEQQRVALAAALAATPDLIIADEAVSALDVSVQAQVLNLLEQHQRQEGTAYIFISHDLAVVRYVSDDILVLYAGHVAEAGPADEVLSAPWHPYTEALLSAVPVADPDATPTRIRLTGAVPTLRERFRGCFFAERCPRKVGPVCHTTPPPAQRGSHAGHVIHCHIPADELRALQANQPQQVPAGAHGSE